MALEIVEAANVLFSKVNVWITHVTGVHCQRTSYKSTHFLRHFINLYFVVWYLVVAKKILGFDSFFNHGLVWGGGVTLRPWCPGPLKGNGLEGRLNLPRCSGHDCRWECWHSVRESHYPQFSHTEQSNIACIEQFFIAVVYSWIGRAGMGYSSWSMAIYCLLWQ